MRGLLDRLLDLPAGIAYTLVGALVFVEDALFIGFVVPGETAAILGGVAAGLGRVSLTAMVAVVVAAAIVGDSVGYEIGRHVGPRLLGGRLLSRQQERLEHAKLMLARRGGAAVFFGRFVAFLRAVTPALAGVVGMPYRRFLFFNAAGGLLWGTGSVLAGYLAGNSYEMLQRIIGRDSAIAIAAVVVLALIAWRVRRVIVNRRRER